MPSGLIIKGIGGFYYVKVQDSIYECKAKGIFRKDAITPLPGDNVSISVIDEEKKKGNIDGIMPRKSQLVRPAAANVDQVAVVLAAKSPQPDFMLVDKLLITAGCSDIAAFICINKIDLDEAGSCEKIAGAYAKAGYRSVLLSSKIDVGFEDLKEMLKGRITAFAGQSGVGKSTILNRIMNSWVMRTGEISEKIERGRHTTRHAELVELDEGGYVVDTPGFSTLELSELQYDKLEGFYPEFDGYREKCRFTRCSHISEPDCGVKTALSKDAVDRGRYERYIELYTELKQRKIY